MGELPDGVVEISLHKFENQVEIFIILGSDHIVKFDKVRVIKFMKKHNLAKGSLSIS